MKTAIAGHAPNEWIVTDEETGRRVSVFVAAGKGAADAVAALEEADAGPSPEEVAAERLAAARHDARESLRQRLDAAAAPFVAGVPDWERDSWEAKKTEAAAVLAGNATGAVILEAEAGLRGLTVDDLAAMVMAKADLFKRASGILAGLRRVAEDAISAAATPEDVQDAKTDFETAIAAAMAGLAASRDVGAGAL